MPLFRLEAQLAVLVVAVARAAAAPALQPLPADVVHSLAGALASSEIVLLELEPDGRVGQITLLGYAAAPPALVRQLVADPSLYPRYVRNLTRSDVEPRPDGSVLNRWRLSFPIGSFEGTDLVRPLPAAAGGVGPVEIRSLGEGKQGMFRWEFLPAPGGGTLVVSYGRYDPLDNFVLRALMRQNPELEAGFHVAGGLSLLRALLAQAERQAQQVGPCPARPSAGRLDLTPLLRRGTVAIVRTGSGGALTDVSIVERVAAPQELLLHLVRTPETWPRFLRSVSRLRVTRRLGDGIEFRMTVGSFLFDVVTDYRTLFTDSGADNLAIGGAMKGARFRWDLSGDGPSASVAVWRGNIRLGDTSALVRAMLRIEPSFEHGANLSIGLLSVRAMATYALQLLRSGRAAGM
ncbi:MAG: SRPBCC family protein [Myxococcales bacterium]|nr:SRPBCC family protein [Myxococcota bacterium]MDW8284224.1 SRPBCC family protein [Myxococcales bacterium]